MKFNKITDVTKILIFAATVVIVCILCAVGFKMANEGKSSVASGTNKYNEMASKQNDTEFASYDGSTILGSQLVDLVKITIDNGDYLAIEVTTLSASKSYNYTVSGSGTESSPYELAEVSVPKPYSPNTEDPNDKGNDNYINTSAEFIGSVKRNSNGNIIALVFKQLK